MRSLRTLPTTAMRLALASFVLLLLSSTALASEADLAIPDLSAGNFTIAGHTIDAWHLLFYGSFVIVGTLFISLSLRRQIKNLPAHQSMLDISEIIFQTCKTYLIQQGKFLMMLFTLIAVAMMYYFVGLQHKSVGTGLMVLAFALVGIVGSYWVAWYGIRVNTYANSRTAFASLRGEPWDVVNIPLRAGMSIGLFLISLELVMMVIILLFVPSRDRGHLLPGLRHRRVVGCFGPAYRRRYFHQDRRHRLGPDEDRLQRQGRRSA